MFFFFFFFSSIVMNLYVNLLVVTESVLIQIYVIVQIHFLLEPIVMNASNMKELNGWMILQNFFLQCLFF